MKSTLVSLTLSLFLLVGCNTATISVEEKPVVVEESEDCYKVKQHQDKLSTEHPEFKFISDYITTDTQTKTFLNEYPHPILTEDQIHHLHISRYYVTITGESRSIVNLVGQNECVLDMLGGPSSEINTLILGSSV